MNSKNHTLRKTSRGFTLIELMAVMVIISIMLGITFSSTKSFTGSRDLNLAVETISRSMSMARQLSMTKGVPVLVAVSPVTADGDTARQAMLLLEGNTATNGTIQWSANSPWQMLPKVVHTDVFSRNSQATFYDSASPDSPLTSALPLKLNGQDISNYSYIIFRPDGTVDAPQNGPSLTLTRQGKNNHDYIILVQENSGRSKVIEP